jgi:hypothetical protein
MIELILAGVGTVAASAAVVWASRSYEGGYSDAELATINRERAERATRTGPGYLGYGPDGYYAQRADGTPSGYARPHGVIRPQGDGTFKITSAEGVRREPPPYSGPGSDDRRTP